MAGPRFKVEVRLLPREAGGRRSGIHTGYRPDWDVGNTWLGKPTINGGQLLLEGRDVLAQGEQCVARIEPIVPELWGRIRVGSMISAQEGSRVVAHARVLEVVDRPAYWSPEVGRFVDEANQSCAFVERAGEYAQAERFANAQRRLLGLYTAALELPRLAPNEGEEKDRTATRPTIDFDKHDFYYVIFDPYEESEAVGGSLADDFGDIYGDVKSGLELWNDEGSRVNAIWQWHFTFDAHWGRHAIRALGALHHACSRWK